LERDRVICLFLFVVFIFIFSSCHPRHVSDIKPTMTKEEVVSLWGRTNLITHKTVNGITLETWEYHFAGSGSICRVTFDQDRVTASPQCARPLVGGTYYSQSEQTEPGFRSIERSLIRESFFAMRLTEALKIGPVKSEAEAEDLLALAGIAPKNGWIADYPVTPDIIGELRNAIALAADSGKIEMNKSDAIKAFEDLVIEIESQYSRIEPSPSWGPYPEPYYYPYLYYYPYPYYFGGYYHHYRAYYYPYHYPYYPRPPPPPPKPPQPHPSPPKPPPFEPAPPSRGIHK
jgi:hypothetical protein